MTRLRLLVLLPALVACGVEFSEPLLDTSAVFSVGVELTDSLPRGEVQVSGALWTGYTADGAERAVTDASFQVLGRTIGPAPGPMTDSRWTVRYYETWGLDPDLPLGSVEVEAPAVAGIEETAPLLRLTPPWRMGPASVSVAPGAPLRLELATAVEPADSVFEYWRLDLVKDGRGVAEMSATGPVPSTVEVPWAMLAGLADGGEARLYVYQSVNAPAGRRYRGGLALRTSHVWFVTVEP